jgi:hypothetical protein
MAPSDPLAGLGRIIQALRLLDSMDASQDPDVMIRTAALRPRLHRLALQTLEADLDTLEAERPADV